jgi:hypothetical protein
MTKRRSIVWVLFLDTLGLEEQIPPLSPSSDVVRSYLGFPFFWRIYEHGVPLVKISGR